MNLPYRALSIDLQERFGQRLHRIALDAGSDCPNRDGSKGRGGCVYCDVDGSGNGFLRSGFQIAEQVRRGLAWLRRQHPGTRPIAYLQSYSNTYGSLSRLEEILESLKPFEKEISVLSIATRPDTFPESAAQLLASYKKHFPVWVEFGLETADDQTLQKINRLHTLAEYHESVSLARRYELEVVAHVILGFPGEDAGHFERTAQAVVDSQVDGVKVHQLMVLRKTVLARWHEEGKVAAFDELQYVRHLCDFLERMPTKMAIHRIMADANPGELIAPIWKLSKNQFRDLLCQEFARRSSKQGTKALMPKLLRKIPSLQR